MQERILFRPAVMLASRGVTADFVTGTGFAVGLVAVPLIALHLYCCGARWHRECTYLRKITTGSRKT